MVKFKKIRQLSGFLLLGISFLLLCSCDSNNKITGVVFDENKKPLSGAQVEIKNSKYITSSDKNGLFSLDYAPSKIEILISKDNYIPTTTSITLSTKDGYKLKDTILTKLPKTDGMYIKDNNSFKTMEKDNIRIKDIFRNKKSSKMDYIYAGVSLPKNNINSGNSATLFYYGERSKLRNMKAYKLRYINYLSIFFGATAEGPSYSDVKMWTIEKDAEILISISKKNEVPGLYKISFEDRLEDYSRYILITEDIDKIKTDVFGNYEGYVLTQVPNNLKNKFKSLLGNSMIPINIVKGAYLGITTGAGGRGYFTLLDKETNKEVEITPDENTNWFLDENKVKVSCDGGCWPDVPKSVTGCNVDMEQYPDKLTVKIDSKNCDYLIAKEKQIFKFRDKVINMLKKNQCLELKSVIDNTKFLCTKPQIKDLTKMLNIISHGNYAGYSWGQYQYEKGDHNISLQESREIKLGYSLDLPFSFFDK